MSYEVGQAWIQISPSFRGVIEAISAEAAKWGESAGSTFSDTFKARVDAALKSLPDAKIGVDATEADAKLAQIRADLESLSGANVGVDLSDAEAIAKLDVLKMQLDELGAKNPSIKVEVNAASAELELAAVAVEADVVGKGLVDVGNSSGGASGGLSGLASSAAGAASGMSPLIGGMIALGAALVPIGGLAAGALTALPALIAGATTGLGALYLGFSGIPGALQAFSASQKAPVGSGSSAGTALSNATSERNAANSVQSAEEALANARINGARSVTSAEQAAAAARVTANQSIATAENNLVNAERTVTQAQYAEAQAQDAVVTARENAQRQLDDYTNQLADAGLAARQAALDVTTTKAALDAANAPGSGASSSQLAQAQLTYDQALQRVTDLQTQNQQLTQDAQAAQVAGVDGNTAVLSAEHQLTDAKQATIDATAVQQAALVNIGPALIAANLQIIQSETAVTQAKRSTTQSIADAQRSLEQALASQADAFARAAIPTGTGATAMKAYEQALAGLTPAGREFVDFVTGTLYPVFEGLKAKVQEAFLPLIQTGLTDMLPFFRDLGPLIEVAAKGIGGTFDELAKFMGSKTGLAEIMQIFKEGNGFMAAMGGNFVTIFEAITSIGAQAGPIVKAMSDGITSMVNDFAKWAENGGFEKFLKWIQTNGPGIVVNVENLAKMVGNFVVAITPVGVAIDDVLTFLKDFIDVVNNPFGHASVNWGNVWNDIKNFTVDAWNAIDRDVIQPMENFFTNTIPSILGDAVGFFTDLPGRIVTGLGDFVGAIFHGLLGAGKWIDDNVITPVVSFFKALPGDIVKALGDFTSKVWGVIVLGGSWLEDHIGAPIVNFFEGLPGKIAAVAKGMWHGITDAFRTVLVDIANLWNDSLGKINFHLPSWIPVIGGDSFGFPTITVPKFHDGGVVGGMPGVEQLALLMPGEIVTPAQTAIPGGHGNAPLSLALTINGADLSHVEFFRSIVADAFNQFATELEPLRVA